MAAAPTDLAVALHDLVWVLPRAITADGDSAQLLPATEFEIMRLLVRRPGLSVGETASTLRLHPANVSTALRALEARGLLERHRDGGDARVVRLRPTAAALAHRREQERAWSAALARVLATLPPADSSALASSAPALHALAGALASAGEPA